MKKLCLFLVTFIVAFTLSAQDIVITKNDDFIKVYNLEIGNSAIFYTLTDDPNAPVNKMAKDEVFIIKKADGTKIDFESKSSPQTVVEKPTPVQNNEPNNQLISDWNNFKFELTDYKPTSNAKHNNMLVKLGYKSTSQLTDGNIAVHYEIGKYYSATYGVTFIIQVENLTDKMIFVDMANSVYTSEEKGVIAMYSNAVTSNTNVDAIAGGIPLIGGASATANTTTKAELRIIPIPPHTTVNLPYKIATPFSGYYDYHRRFVNPIQDLSISTLEKLPMGQSLFFTEQDATREMFTLIAYSFNENTENEYFVRTDFYLQQILKLGYCTYGLLDETKLKIDKLNIQRIDGPVFVPFEVFHGGHRIDYKWYCKP